MGVWSSTSCRFDKRRNTRNYESRNSSVKQVLNIDSNRFITLVRQDMQEIRIQDLDQFQNSVQPLMNYLTKCCFPTYFEYSMGGNLRFYKEHLQQDFELKNKLYSLKNSRQQLRKSSHSDNDSEPEALRYVLKPPDTAPVVNTIAEEPELSFDDYSSIYQPEFMLNINSKSLVQEVPKIALRDYNREIEDTRKNDRHLSKPSSWSSDLIDDPSPVRLLENLTVLTSNQKDMFENYTSSIQRETYARKKLDSKDKPSKENVEMRPVPDKTTEKKMSKNMSLQSQLNKKEQEKKSSEDTSIGGKKVMNTFGEKSTLKQELRSVEKKDKSVNQNRILIQDKSKERDEIINLVQDKMNSAEGKGKEEEQKKKPIHDIRQEKKESIDKCKAVGCKPRQPNTLQRSEKYAKAGNKTVLKEKSSKQAKKEYVNNPSPSPPNKVKLKMDLSEKSEKKTETSIRSLLLENDMRAAYYDTVRPQVKNTSPSAIDNHSVSNSPSDSVFRSSMDTNRIFDDVDLFEGLEIACDKKLSEQTVNDEEFYPASPISELHFFKTPCSTRQNSLEIFEKIESECIDLDNIKKENEKTTQDITVIPTTLATYKKLPKEYQEIAKRLSKRNNQSPKKSLPAVNQVNSFLNFSCSSSTCSTMSPRSPSGRTLFRTPSYKMPKTPSLSRQHPSTYVTQHTSSRSRPSSRVSSRAPSPTRGHIEALL